MTITRESLQRATIEVLGAHAARCDVEHGVIAGEIADKLGLEHPTLAPTLPAPPTDLDLGIWIDDSPKLVLTAAYLAKLRALPLSHVAVFVETFDDGFDARWTEAHVSALASALPGQRIALTITPEPTQAYMAELRKKLPGLIRACGASFLAVELDLEGPWKSGKVVGYASLKIAGQALVSIVHAAALSVGVGNAEIEVTTFPAHLEARVGGAVLGEDRLYLQTYSVAEARGEKRDHDGPLGPARRPYEDVIRVRAKAEPGLEICAGLAAWEQADWPGDPVDAMALALDSAIRAGVRRVRWWSSRHVIGASANSYAVRAIESFRPLSRRKG